MSISQDETIIQAVKERFDDYLTPARKRGTYLCPLCGNGSGSDGTGMEVYANKKTGELTQLHCFKCGFDGDLLDLYQKETGKAFPEALADLADRFHIAGAGSGESSQKRIPSQRTNNGPRRGTSPQGYPDTTPSLKDAQRAPERDYRPFYEEARKILWSEQGKPGLDYLHGRGLTDETIYRFGLGFTPSWQDPKAGEQRGSRRVIVPLWEGGYEARSIDTDAQGIAKRHVGPKRPFHGEALALAQEDPAQIPILVEGAFDALALSQWGYPVAVALCGVEPKGLIEAAKQTCPDAVFLLVLDNDKGGLDAQPKVAAALEEAGLHCVCPDLPALYGLREDGTPVAKDAGELNPLSREEQLGFCDRLAPYLIEAWELQETMKAARERELYLKTGRGMADACLEEFFSQRYRPIPTGIPAIDRATGGGLMRQTLILLGAEPGAGKTALASMIFESMAKDGHTGLFFNLEMSRQQLFARSLSRIAFQTEGSKLTGTDILRAYSLSPEEQEVVRRANETYKETVADHLIYNFGDVGTSVDLLLAAMEEEATRREAAGEEAPLICVDYLQLLTGAEREDVQSVLKRAVSGLKDYAVKHNSIVLAIMAQNRFSNDIKRFSLSAGRDTSALEYSADLLFQLVRANEEEPDEVTFGVVKNRFGPADTRLEKGTKFTFLGGQSTFLPVESRYDDSALESGIDWSTIHR